MTSSAELASATTAALLARGGVTDTFSQLAKAALATTALTDYSKTSATTAALLARGGVTDTFSQLAKSLAVGGVSDYGLTSAIALLALARPPFGVHGSHDFGNPPASWTPTAVGD